MNGLPSEPRTRKRFAGFEIAVHDPEGVRLGDGLERLEHVVRGFLDRERAALAEEHAEVCALQVLHHHERRAVREEADVEHAGHVLARDPDGVASLAREPGHGLFVLQHRGQ